MIEAIDDIRQTIGEREDLGEEAVAVPAAIQLVERCDLDVGVEARLVGQGPRFGPSGRDVIDKTRVGAKVRRRYDKPATPYARLLASATLAKAAARDLTAFYKTLNPAELRREVHRHQQRLIAMTATKTRTAPRR